MKTLRSFGTAATWSLLAATTALADSSDSFGIGVNAFTIDFVSVLYAGNPDDAGAGGGIYSSPYGGVLTEYRMGKFEISQEQIDKATAGGLVNVIAGAHTGAEPAANITWYEAAAFANWLNESTGHQKAYDLNGTATALTLWSSGDAWDNDHGAGVDLNLYRHKDAYYFLPSEDEWYKAAYHKNDGVTANYWDYATGSNSAPTQELTGGTTPGWAVYSGAAGFPADPADVNLAGGLSAYGTMGQNGNVFEWNETGFAGSNNSPSEGRVNRGGFWGSSQAFFHPGSRLNNIPSDSIANLGFRVASVPEPSSAMLILGSGLMWLARRRLGSSI